MITLNFTFDPRFLREGDALNEELTDLIEEVDSSLNSYGLFLYELPRVQETE